MVEVVEMVVGGTEAFVVVIEMVVEVVAEEESSDILQRQSNVE